MNKSKKIDGDFEKTRQSHLSIQRDFVNKIQSKQLDESDNSSVNL